MWCQRVGVECEHVVCLYMSMSWGADGACVCVRGCPQNPVFRSTIPLR